MSQPDAVPKVVEHNREDDVIPKEEFVPHMAGSRGYGRSSFINDIVLRNRDANTAWTAQSDGNLEQQFFYCSNWRGDVVALVRGSRYQVEQVRYSAYGVPFGYPGGDADSDGDADTDDKTIIASWAAAPTYDVRGDLNLDGVVDSTDVTVFSRRYLGTTMGNNVLSSEGNTSGFAGMIWSVTEHYFSRYRVYSAELGKWLTRDPIRYLDSPNLYMYSQSSPIRYVDPLGLTVVLFQHPVAGDGEAWPMQETGLGRPIDFNLPNGEPRTMGDANWKEYTEAIENYLEDNYEAEFTTPLVWKFMGSISRELRAAVWANANINRRARDAAWFFAGPFDDARRNFLQHCIASCMATSMGGGFADTAEWYGNAREDWQEGGNDSIVDRFANSTGRVCARRWFPGQQLGTTNFDACVSCCSWMYDVFESYGTTVNDQGDLLDGFLTEGRTDVHVRFGLWDIPIPIE